MVAHAGYHLDEPLMVATQQGNDPPAFLIQGPATNATRIHVASLAKQFVAACAALLVQTGQLDFGSHRGWGNGELPGGAGSGPGRNRVWRMQ